ncbi:MAG: hypothetical protein ILP02_04970 [Clostridia bacterium]|nr:hypothetical protein [Clostridia bacterium]
MKNKLKAIIILALLAVTFAALSACTGGTAIDEYFSKGYQIKVTYDGNGGKFVGKEGNQLVDLYNPARYEADASNTVHIPLVVPTEREIAGEAVSITKAGYVVAGWYTEREIVKNTEGKVVDESGVAIDYVDGAYVYENGEPAEPAYTYGGHWDFASDTVDYVLGSGKKEVTLYACWVPDYQFNYYMRAGEEWKLVETSTFDYKTSKEKGLLRENVWIPSYVDGAMNYEHTYRVNGSTYTYTFPKARKTSPSTRRSPTPK